MYGVVDLYGECVEVRLVESLKFHCVCGKNITLSQDQLSAQRQHSNDDFRFSTVFSSRPLNHNEWFALELVSVGGTPWKGSLQLGID